MITSIPDNLEIFIKNNRDLLEKKEIQCVTFHLKESVHSICIKRKVKEDSTTYIVIDLNHPNNKINIFLDDKNNITWEISNKSVQKTILIFENNVYSVNQKEKYYPVSVHDLEFFPMEIKETIFSAYSGNNSWKDFISENFYPPIKLVELTEYHNKKDYCEKLFNVRLPQSANKIPFKLLYALCCSKDYIHPEQFLLLFSWKVSINYDITPSKRKKKHIAKKYLKTFFKSRIENINEYILTDYIDMSIEMKQPIDITAGKKRIQTLHNELIDRTLAKEYRGIELSIPQTPMKYLCLPKEFILLKNKKALILEGKLNHNCVGTYVNRINSGHSIVYAATIKGEHLTIEIKYRKSKSKKLPYKIYVSQCYKAYNKVPDKDITEYVKDCVDMAAPKAIELFLKK